MNSFPLSEEDYWLCVCAARLQEIQPAELPLPAATCSDLARQLYAIESFRSMEPVAAANTYRRSAVKAA